MLLTSVTTPIVRHFEVSDVASICNRDGVQIPAASILEQAASGPAWTAMLEEQPVACGGITLPWPGVGMAWMIVSQGILAHRIWFTRTVRRFLRSTIRQYELHRVEAVALESATVNQRWLEALGLTREEQGRARKYLSDRRPILRYEWVKGPD